MASPDNLRTSARLSLAALKASAPNDVEALAAWAQVLADDLTESAITAGITDNLEKGYDASK